MFTVYIYALDTMADWEFGYVTAELNSGRFFKKDVPKYQSKQPRSPWRQSKQWEV